MHDLLDQALQEERLGRFDEARDRLREAISRGETTRGLDARLRLGKLLIQAGPPGFEEAESVLAEARRHAEGQGAIPQAAAAIRLLALLERSRGRLDEAYRLLDESPAPGQAATPGAVLGQYHHYRGLVEADRGAVNDAE